MTLSIAYILCQFPLPSETFVINEVISLQTQECDIHPISLFGSQTCQKDLMSHVKREGWDLSALKVYDEAQKTSFLPATKIETSQLELPERFAWYAALVAEYITTHKIELLHAHFATEAALVAMIAAKATGVPFTVTAHAYDIFIHQKGKSGAEQLERRLALLCEHASRIITISDFNRNHINSLTNRKSPQKITRVHCGIDPDVFTVSSKEVTDSVTLLCVGRFVEKKGYEYLIRAFAQAHAIRGNLRLRLVGDGPLRQMMEMLCADLKIEDFVDFLGSIGSEKVKEEMHSADIFLLHSVTAADGDREGIPVSLMEASATGLPVLSTRHSGIPELVADGASGFLVEERDVAGFSNCIIALASAPELRKRMGMVGSELVAKNFNLHQECSKLKSHFTEVVLQSQKAERPISVEMTDDTALTASVIICTYNRADLLGDSILAMTRQNFPAERFEIIVVDNNSADETEQIVRDLAAFSPVRVKYIFEGQQGLSYARNTGIRNATGQILAFIDDDIDASDSWLRSIVCAFKEPDVYAVGGPIRPLWLVPRPGWLSDRWLGHFTVSEFSHAKESGEYSNPNYPWGANMAFRKTLFDGGSTMFPTDLGRVGKCLLSNEEIYLFRSIEAAGQKIRFAPDAVIHHKIPPERMRRLWLYHRTYWQGRSNAVIDINEGKILYQNLLKNLATLSWCTTSKSETEFDRKCIEKAAFGYIYQVLNRSAEKGDFRKLRALKILLRTILGTAPSNKPATTLEAPNRFAQKLLRQKDEQIDELLNSWSWKVTRPLRYGFDLINKIKGMSNKG